MTQNYFDFCNLTYGDNKHNNASYGCDIVNVSSDNEYNPKRSEGVIRQGKFDT